MKLLIKNSLFRVIALSRFFNYLGASIYNLVFVVFAASLSHAKFAVGTANIILLAPILFTVYVGKRADQTHEKGYWLIATGYIQAILFVLVAMLTYQKSLIAFSFVCLINIISDILSDYRGGLQMPIFQKNIPEEDRMEAYSFTQFLSIICSISGQALGVWLLAISNQNFFFVASINALAFLLSSTILYFYRKQLTHAPVTIKKSEKNTSFLTQAKEIFKLGEKIFQKEEKSNFILLLAIIAIINALGGSLNAIFNLSLLNRPFWNLTFSQSLFLIQVVVMAGMVLGSLTPRDYFAKLSVAQIVLWAILPIVLIGLNQIFYSSQLITLLSTMFLMYLAAKVNPKLNALLLNSLPSDVLAQTSSFLSLLFSLSLPVGTTLFTALAVWNMTICWTVFTLLGLFALGLAWKNR